MSKNIWPGTEDPQATWFQRFVRARSVSRVFLLFCPLLSLGVLARHFANYEGDLDEDIPFKIAVSGMVLAFAAVYAFAEWVSHLRNDEGVEVGLGGKLHGSDVTGFHLFYCGRDFPIPGSDGTCGPTNGPQCDSCTRFQLAASRWHITPSRARYIKELQDSMNIIFWFAPLISVAVSLALWSAPEVDLICKPQTWEPMIPWLASFYLPHVGSPQDHDLMNSIRKLSVFNPIMQPPDLLLPNMQHPIALRDRVQRTFYFVMEMGGLTVITCLILEAVKWLCKAPKNRELSNRQGMPSYQQLASNLPRSASSGIFERAPSLLYLGVFVAYYICYQGVLYGVMDVGVAHGLMNLTTGSVWELWVLFVEMVLVTALCTGVPWYVMNIGSTYESPTSLIILQLMPWLGNEVHIMKDHIAQALCFATAHCHSGHLRNVALALGYLSFGATVFPLFFLFSNPVAFRGLRGSHWSIPESAIDKKPLGMSWKRYLKQKRNEMLIQGCTSDKYTRAIAGEIPHGIIHVIFAFFFGGSVFIFSAIALSAAKIVCIPVARLFLRRAIPSGGCREFALEMFLTRTNTPEGVMWRSADDAILKAYKYDWQTTLGLLRVFAPDLDNIFNVRSDVADSIAPGAVVEVVEQFILGQVTLVEGQYGKVVEIESDGSACILFGGPEDEELNQEVLVHKDNFDKLARVNELDVLGEDRFVTVLCNAAATGDADHYINFLRVLRHSLGLREKKLTAITMQLVVAGKIPESCLSVLQEIVQLGGSGDIQQYAEELSEHASSDTMKATLLASASGLSQAAWADQQEEVQTRDFTVEYTDDWRDTISSKIDAFMEVNNLKLRNMEIHDKDGNKINFQQYGIQDEQFPIHVILTGSILQAGDDGKAKGHECKFAVCALFFSIMIPLLLWIALPKLEISM